MFNERRFRNLPTEVLRNQQISRTNDYKKIKVKNTFLLFIYRNTTEIKRKIFLFTV